MYPQSGTTRGWEALTIANIVATALYMVLTVANTMLGFAILVHAAAPMSAGARVLASLGIEASFLLYIIVRRVWFVRTRRAIALVHADPDPILKHPLMRGWLIAIVASFAINCVAAGAIIQNPIAASNPGASVVVFVLSLASPAIGGIAIAAAIAVRRLMRALPPAPEPPPAAPRPPKVRASQRELADLSRMTLRPEVPSGEDL